LNLFFLPCLRSSASVCGKKRFSRNLLQVLIAHNDYGKFSGEEHELPTLKKFFPLYGLYLLLLSAWPTTLPLAEWPNALDYGRLTEVQRIVFASRFIEVMQP
jgi:hypothetical protein